MKVPARDFVTLDGLRGIAAFAVVAGHLCKTAEVPRDLLFEAYLPVDFFFILSGFVLAHAYGQKLSDGLSPLRLMTVRVIRLYPLYLLAWALGFLLEIRTASLGYISFSTAAINGIFGLLFLPTPVVAALFPLNFPAWSLFFELVVNAAWALIARHLHVRMLATIVAVAALLLIVAVSLGWFGFAVRAQGFMNAGYNWSTFGAGALRVSFSFFAGVLVYRTWRRWTITVSVPPVILCGALLIIFSLHPVANLDYAYDLVATILLFPLIVALGASSKPGKYLATVFSILGQASYGIYVLQHPIYRIIIKIFPQTYGISPTGVSAIAAIAFISGLFVLVLVLDYFYDVPVRRWLTARFLRLPRATPVIERFRA